MYIFFMTLSESDKRIGMKRSILMGQCSLNVVNLVLFNKDMTEPNKMKTLERAKIIAKSKGRYRIFIEDWSEALKES